MHVENTNKGIEILGHLADAAAVEGAKFNYKALSILLTAFDHHTSEDGTYVMPQKLIAAAIAEFEEKGKASLQTAENIRAAFGTGGGVS